MFEVRRIILPGDGRDMIKSRIKFDSGLFASSLVSFACSCVVLVLLLERKVRRVRGVNVSVAFQPWGLHGLCGGQFVLQVVTPNAPSSIQVYFVPVVLL